MVAFATHGIMPAGLPGVSKPALALAGTTEPGDSPLLVLDDVLSLQLNAQWVVLSATFKAGAANRSRAASLRDAQLAMLDGQLGGAWSHPFFWSPYALFGDPAR